MENASYGAFDELSPTLALEAVEEAFSLRLDGSISTYPSYVNRVYGFRSDEGEAFVAKFYRPGRWSAEAIAEEHRFIAACAADQIPVVSPIPQPSGDSLAVLELESDSALTTWHFALFPKRGGRAFDAEGDGDWRRLGAVAGRIHAAGRRQTPRFRSRLDSDLVRFWLALLGPLVHPDLRGEFLETVGAVLDGIGPRLDAFESHLIHGDLHRGNILDRPGEGLLVIDFDDCLRGPPVHDLWLLLPDRAEQCERELSLLVEGYSDFAELEEGSMAFVESLRFLRMLHFLAWRARQREDAWFKREFPDWGGRAFWILELEDLRDQARFIHLPG
jgi:Ser/Thr protein kinase RdoA (MazF antagonist)